MVWSSETQISNRWFHSSSKSGVPIVRDPDSIKDLVCSGRLSKVVRSRSAFPPSDSINPLTLFSTSSATTHPFSTPSIGIASAISSTSTTRFSHCSAYSGHATIGTPAVRASNTEFHPHRVLGSRAAHHPQESLPASLQPNSDLLELSRGEEPQAAEAQEHDAAARLQAEPVHAIPSPLTLLLGDQRPDAVDGWGRGVGHARAVGYVSERAWLELIKRVDEDAIRVGDKSSHHSSSATRQLKRLPAGRSSPPRHEAISATEEIACGSFLTTQA
ncbi:hypothetical protein CKAN_02239800 [Cinnamomum micranthum f. kanehirae]|uniref:Uncharacterized protein n=1 Tax=Cinnamomum micranthum f. kanehirae TaxID=337451 RepID=A0A443PQY3_9MAGN|nr:hypothetical protein CKAN_02239800 [Cinnamomum micranthum f. kanehirae]